MLFRKKEAIWDKKIICSLDPERYMGKWYEIARYPHRFEKNLEKVTAEYTLLENGNIKVINSGLKNGVRTKAEAVAYLPDPDCTGKLLVSFFRPFKGQYNVILLDEENYSYAIVVSKGLDYLWFLCREPKISDELYQMFIDFVIDAGFSKEKIIKVNQ